MPYSFSLKSRPLYQTLSKAFETSQKKKKKKHTCILIIIKRFGIYSGKYLLIEELLSDSVKIQTDTYITSYFH